MRCPVSPPGLSCCSSTKLFGSAGLCLLPTLERFLPLLAGQLSQLLPRSPLLLRLQGRELDLRSLRTCCFFSLFSFCRPPWAALFCLPAHKFFVLSPPFLLLIPSTEILYFRSCVFQLKIFHLAPSLYLLSSASSPLAGAVQLLSWSPLTTERLWLKYGSRSPTDTTQQASHYSFSLGGRGVCPHQLWLLWVDVAEEEQLAGPEGSLSCQALWSLAAESLLLLVPAGTWSCRLLQLQVWG